MQPKIPKSCPVQPFTDQVLQSAEELAGAITRLKRSMRACEVCAYGFNCPILNKFNQKFQTALQQVTEEWQLT